MSRRLADVAQHLGISEASVSRALNGKKGVSEDTRRAVLTALDVLGYERPAKLHAERARSVGIMVAQDRHGERSAAAEAASSVLAAQGFLPVLAMASEKGELADEAHQLAGLLNQEIAGLLLLGSVAFRPGPARDLVQQSLASGLPVVRIGGGGAVSGVPAVVGDDQSACELALRHLAALGHREVVFLVSVPEDDVTVRRTACATRTATDLGLLLRLVEFDDDTLEARVMELSHGDATAVLVEEARTGLQASAVLRRYGLTLPADCSVVCLGDSGIAGFGNPALTVVREPADEMARAAVTMLLELLEGDSDVAPRELLFAPDLLVRGSTASPSTRLGVAS